MPLHEMVKVDLSFRAARLRPTTIFFAITELLEGRMPDFDPTTRFGA